MVNPVLLNSALASKDFRKSFTPKKTKIPMSSTNHHARLRTPKTQRQEQESPHPSQADQYFLDHHRSSSDLNVLNDETIDSPQAWSTSEVAAGTIGDSHQLGELEKTNTEQVDMEPISARDCENFLSDDRDGSIHELNNLDTPENLSAHSVEENLSTDSNIINPQLLALRDWMHRHSHRPYTAVSRPRTALALNSGSDVIQMEVLQRNQIQKKWVETQAERIKTQRKNLTNEKKERNSNALHIKKANNSLHRRHMSSTRKTRKQKRQIYLEKVVKNKSAETEALKKKKVLLSNLKLLRSDIQQENKDPGYYNDHIEVQREVNDDFEEIINDQSKTDLISSADPPLDDSVIQVDSHIHDQDNLFEPSQDSDEETDVEENRAFQISLQNRPQSSTVQLMSPLIPLGSAELETFEDSSLLLQRASELKQHANPPRIEQNKTRMQPQVRSRRSLVPPVGWPITPKSSLINSPNLSKPGSRPLTGYDPQNSSKTLTLHTGDELTIWRPDTTPTLGPDSTPLTVPSPKQMDEKKTRNEKVYPLIIFLYSVFYMTLSSLLCFRLQRNLRKLLMSAQL